MFKAYISMMIGNHPECLHTFESAIRQGYCLPLDFSWFDPLRDDARFQELYTENRRLIARAQETATMKFEVHLPEGHSEAKEYPVFFALHGDGGGGNIKEFGHLWKPDVILQHGFIVVYIQSSQVRCTNGFGWLPNPEIARRDIADCYERVCAETKIDHDRVLIGGFSGGASAALDITLANILPVSGFVSLCASAARDSFTRKNAEQAMRRGVRGFLMDGETGISAKAQELIDLLQELAFPFKLHIIPGMGHTMPPNLDKELELAMAYVAR